MKVTHLTTENRMDRRELLAEYNHNAWSGWMAYLFEKCETPFSTAEGKEYIIPAWAVKRWTRQMTTLYKDLPEDEKKSDLEEADRMIAIINTNGYAGR